MTIFECGENKKENLPTKGSSDILFPMSAYDSNLAISQATTETPEVFSGPDEKPCTKCGIVKKLQEYSRSKKEKDGRADSCKLCIAAYMRLHYQKTKTEWLARSKRWRDKNKDSVSEYQRAWYERNKMRLKPIREKYAKAHKTQAYIAARKHYVNNRSSVLARTNAYRINNPLVGVAACARRRALKAGTHGRVSRNQLRSLIEAQKNKCFYCGEFVDGKGEFDHKIPISRGGSHSIENLVFACWYCNRSKGAKTIEEFYDYRRLLALQN